MRELQYRMPEVIKNGHILIAPEFEGPLGAGAVYALEPKVDVSCGPASSNAPSTLGIRVECPPRAF